MEYVTLNNGIKMPKLGYGVYQTPPEDTKRCVLDAIDVGSVSPYGPDYTKSKSIHIRFLISESLGSQKRR